MALDAGRARLDLATGLLAPRVVRVTGCRAEVALVATTATLLGGDEVRLDVEVGTGTWLDLRDVAGTVAYHGRGRACRVDVRLTVAPGGTLTWAGEPLVVSGGAVVTRTLDVDVAAGGRLLLRDTVALGRSGEAGGDLRCTTTACVDGRPALVEELRLGPSARSQPGVLGGARVVDTVTALGWRPTGAPDVPSADVYVLERGGTVARVLAGEAHQSRLRDLWDHWGAQLEASDEPPL
ncbi:urease accessory protein UreD [Pedococcus sp. NPDC057267]|uniref:urease accessory protein UreD n=1 Tax=Pedococcus sp. NPDC057267 TaxID=3346077 RepID=UPI00362F435C